ncbi:MAG TPA: hypothetical protein VLE97_04855 [Gaiellaceae bacterium]|nr:hypothetical protein [Gaiellaceae bacterium]
MRPLLPLAAIAALLLAGAARGASATPPTATVTSAFAGLSSTDTVPLDPPDMGVAAGPGFVVQMVNLAMRIWSTGSGAPTVVKTQQLSDFFGQSANSITDPRIEYDTASARWFATLSNIDTPAVLLAVSKTSDPTGAWSMYSFTAPGCADQPRLGIADGIVVIGADIFSTCASDSGTPLGGELWIVNKAQVVAGVTPPAINTFGPNPSFSTFAPVQSLSSTSTEYVVSVDNPTSSVVHLLTVDGIPPAAVSVKTAADIAITPLQEPPNAQQPASSSGRQDPVATNDDRILDSVWEKGRLWFSGNTACIPSGDSFNRACGRIAELATATRTLTWDANVGVAGADVFFPAIRPDAVGNLVVVYGESSPTTNPELVSTVRAPDGTFATPAVIATSAGPHLRFGRNNERFGDYFAAGRDPTNPAVIWFAGEIGSTVAGGAQGWNTALGSVLVSGGGAPPPVVPPVATAPRLKARAAAARARRVVQLRYTALDEGTDVRTQLTVKNPLSTIVYSATSAKKTLHAGTVYSLPYRTTRPGRFTFCFRSILPSGAKSAQSCAVVTVSR